MIVPLLVSAIRIENQEELSSVSSSKDQAMIKAPENNDSVLRREIKSILNGDQGFGIKKRPTSRIIDHRKKRGSKVHRRIGMGTVDTDSPLKTEVLAHKLAKEALKSPKMQETMKKLSHIPKPKKELLIPSSIKVPGRTNSVNKSNAEEKHRRPSKYRRRRKKKKKRHHKHFGEQNSRLPKRGPSKKSISTRRDTSMVAETDSETENSSFKNNEDIDRDALQDKSPTKSNIQINVVKSEENEYIDFSSTPNTESSMSTTQKEITKCGEESMVERLMRTTSKDPMKKNPGDQGIEYSDYYNNDDDVVANKIEEKIVESRNPNDRIIRQTLNSLSPKNENRIAGNVQPGLQNIEKYDNPENSLEDIQNYPGNDGSLELNENSVYPSMLNRVNYGSVLNEDENLNGVYTNTEAIPILDQPEMNDVTLSPQNLDLDSNMDKELQKPLKLSEHNRLNYPEQYDQPNLRNFGVNEGQSSDYNDNSDEVQMGNSVDDFSGRYNKFNSIKQFQDENSASNLANEEIHYDGKENFNNQHSPDGELHISDNYNIPQSHDRSLDYNRNIMFLPRTGNSRLSESIEEDETQQPLYSGKQDLSQFYNNPYENNEEQNLRSFSLQPVDTLNYDSNDSPSLNLPNAMEQPLGKVLETLGINVNRSESKMSPNTNTALRKKNMEDNFIADNRERAGRPVYSVPRNLQRPMNRWKVREDLRNNYGQSHLRPLDFRTAKLGNGNLNLDEYSRGQVALSGNRGRSNLQGFSGENGHTAGTTRSTNISEAVNETKQVANLLLDTIIDELEDLKRDRSKNNKREGLPCQLSGSWLTTQARMKLNMKVMNHAIIVTLSDLSSPSFRESPLNGTWNITGHVPFKHGGPFTLIASDNHTNSVAVFVGACRVCQGIDTIAGVWTISRQPKDCRDFQISTSVFNDVFRKTRLSTMKEKRHSTISDNSLAQNVTNLITLESTTKKKID